MNNIVGNSDIIFLTLDTLRYDVAQQLWAAGRLPNFSKWLSPEGWEKRHSSGSFTYAAHQAFFAGFLPTPAYPGKHPRLFASRFSGSETTVEGTFCFDAPNIVAGLRQVGYRTHCIGGVGFFNKQTPLSCIFPDMFDESYWESQFGVTEKESARYQFEKGAEILNQPEEKIFLFINVSALHQPNFFYLEGATVDSIETHAAALEYVDSQLPILIQALSKRKSAFIICCGDHGTAYGEDGYMGHRIGHSTVWDVPYSDFLFSRDY